jgi:hypothetical protein
VTGEERTDRLPRWVPYFNRIARRDVLAPHARRTRLGSWFVRNIDNPEGAVEGKPVFELRPIKKE